MAGRSLLDTSAAAALLRGDPDVAAVMEGLDEVYTSAVVIPTEPNVVIRGDTIWAVEQDSLDVQTVVRYRKPGRSR